MANSRRTSSAKASRTKCKESPPPGWSLLGIPDHQGVANVGGRLGAALGPAAFRRELGRLKGADGVQEALRDLGDVGGLSVDVKENHERAAESVRGAQAQAGASDVSVVVGGGHDHGYSQLLGVARAEPGQRLGCINIDAHLDVRKAEPLIGSGSPFYLAIENGVVLPRRLLEFGIQPHCNGSELWEYVRKKKVPVAPFETLRFGACPRAFSAALRDLATACDRIVVSLDLDAAAEAFAPGVSAPQAEGFTSSEVIAMAEIAGAHRKVVSLGIFELNPLHDIGSRTARLAAVAAYHFASRALHR